jgi:hypothetical protein
MRSQLAPVAAITICLLVLTGSFSSADPIKWSAPMSAYPNRWVSSPEPPSYYNPYGYRYPYAEYGYGPYDYYGYGTQGYAAGQPVYHGYQQRGSSGNPYMYYYGQ